MTDTTGVSHEVRAGLERLDGIVADMVAAATPLFQSPTRSHYSALLSACYHYTRDSGPQLRYAANLAPNEELRQFFAGMADDEQDHFRLAEADLDALGVRLTDQTPAAITAFADYWYRIGAVDYFQFLGATYVLENLAGCVRTHAVASMVGLRLQPRQSRFIRTHLDADVEHGARVAGNCARYLPTNSEDIVAGAEATVLYWKEGVRAFLASEPADAVT